MANLSLRELSAMTEVSNPNISQIERRLSGDRRVSALVRDDSD
jgi:hypothetical protein